MCTNISCTPDTRVHDDLLLRFNRSPEERVWALLFLADEERTSGFFELLEADLAVVVGVDCVERVGSQFRFQSKDVKEAAVLTFVDHVIVVGVDAMKEQREWSLEYLGGKSRFM